MKVAADMMDRDLVSVGQQLIVHATDRRSGDSVWKWLEDVAIRRLCADEMECVAVLPGARDSCNPAVGIGHDSPVAVRCGMRRNGKSHTCATGNMGVPQTVQVDVGEGVTVHEEKLCVQ